MRVGIDGIIYSLQAGGGISVYFSELSRHLEEVQDLDVDFWMFEPTRAAEPSAPSIRHRKVVAPMRLLERYRACRLAGGRPDVFHSSYYRLPEDASVPSVVTVHDFAYERFRHGPAQWVHRAQKWRAIRAARVVICVSEATADDLLAYVGLRGDQILKVIHNGVADLFEPNATAPIRHGQVLFVGGRGGYKNFRLALEALALLPEMRLVCVGGGTLRADEFAGLAPHVRERVSHLGFVSDAKLATLYRESLCLLYPSSFEGFGIPVAEAMRSGCPVVGLTACKAVLEVAGDALCGVDEPHAAALASGVETLLERKKRASFVSRGLERAARYSWQTAHAQTVEAYREAIKRGPRT